MSLSNTTTDTMVSTDGTNDTLRENYNSIHLWRSHPNLYRSILTFAFLSIALGLNFIFILPPFNPYGFSYWITGGIFLALGLAKLFFLHIYRSLRIVRWLMSAAVGWMLFWGVGTSVTYFQGKTSLQLFIMYVALATFEIWLLIEPFANPLTGKKGA